MRLVHESLFGLFELRFMGTLNVTSRSSSTPFTNKRRVRLTASTRFNSHQLELVRLRLYKHRLQFRTNQLHDSNILKSMMHCLTRATLGFHIQCFLHCEKFACIHTYLTLPLFKDLSQN